MRSTDRGGHGRAGDGTETGTDVSKMLYPCARRFAVRYR